MIEDESRFFKEPHPSRGITGVMEGCLPVIISAWIQIQPIVLDEVGCKLADVNHFCRPCILEGRICNWRHRHFQEIRRAVEGIHILMEDFSYVSAFPSDDPFHPEPFCLAVDLGVQPLGQLC